MTPQIERILKKLSAARAAGRGCFGSNAHGFTLAPALSAAQVAAFEQACGVRLPDGYRDFLLEAGGSGAGPYYGLAPLPEAAVALAEPFPLDYPGGEAAYADLERGSLYLVDQGCSYCARLVVSGPASGRVIYLDQDDSSPPYFVRDENFLDWYERWLDGVLAQSVPAWFGFDNPDYARPAAPKPELSEAQLPRIPPGPFRGRLESIRRRLTEGGDFTAHSAYRLPLAEADLAAFESRFNVSLPADYRAFLQYVQAGGVGPYYGLTPFEYAGPDDDEAHLLAEPFPCSPSEAMRPRARGFKLADGSIFTSGMLYLAHQGRGYYAWLIVSGESRGRVVNINQDHSPIVPYYTRDASFLDWYERWLEAALAGKLPQWFGYDNPDYKTRAYTDKEDLAQITWRPARRKTRRA